MRFAGSYVALVTPFARSGALDEAALRRLVRSHLRAGTAGLVPCGSTGEAATLSHEEYRRVISLTLEESRGLLPVIAGVGTNATSKAVEMAREAESLGADALLVLSPYYNKPTPEGLFQHFRAVARNTRLPVIVYNIPGRTAVNILPRTLLRIAADCPNVVAVKEASGDIDQVSEIVAGAPRGFAVLSGDDSLTVPMMAVGAVGIVSVAANVAPKETAAMCAAALAGDFKKARGLHLRLFPLIKALFVETNPIPVKAALEMMGLCSGRPRLPLTALTAANRSLLRRKLAACGLLLRSGRSKVS
jgi:4-hydroxy-tetrahydrodipicolinate synthase